MSGNRVLAAVLTVTAVTLGFWPVATPAAHAENTTLTTVAGTGQAGFSGDGGPATQAALNHPSGVAVAADGTVYVSDTRNLRIRAISPAGTITTVAGTGISAHIRAAASSKKLRLPDGDKATETDLVEPRELTVGPDGTLYIVDYGLAAILTLSPDGRMFTLAGTGKDGYSGDGGPAKQAQFKQPDGVAVAADGTVYIGDTGNQRLRAVSPDGTITTVAGNGTTDVNGPSAGDATAIPLPAASQPTVDQLGNVWVWVGCGVYRLSEGKLAEVTWNAGDRWGLAKADDNPYDDRICDISALAAGHDGVYLSNRRTGVMVRFDLERNHAIDPVGQFDQLHGDPNVSVGPSEIIHFADSDQNRVYSFRPVLSAEESAPKWPFAVAAAGAVAGLALATWLLLRRRSARRATHVGQ